MSISSKNTSFNVRPDIHTSDGIDRLSPEAGVIVFNENTKKNRYYDGTRWLEFPYSQEIITGGITITQQVERYSDLDDGGGKGDLAYVEKSQGTNWLPNTLGGTYYPKGFYIWTGTEWVSDRNAISNQLELNSVSIMNLEESVQTINEELNVSGGARFENYLVNVEYTGQDTLSTDGTILQATINGNSVYRYITSNVNENGYPLEDSFYSDEQLNNLIVTRG